MRGKPKSTARRRGVKAWWALPVIGVVWAGCSVERHYETLSFFFDGVPDPSVVRELTDAGGNVVGAIVSAHDAFAERHCQACHGESFDYGFRVTGFTKPGPDVCLDCHESELERFDYLHGPVVARACRTCHVHHESRYPHLLTEEPVALCQGCHAFHMEAEPRPEHHADLERSCLDCHHGHGGVDPYFLRELLPPDEPDAIDGEGDAGDAEGAEPPSGNEHDPDDPETGSGGGESVREPTTDAGEETGRT